MVLHEPNLCRYPIQNGKYSIVINTQMLKKNICSPAPVIHVWHCPYLQKEWGRLQNHGFWHICTINIDSLYFFSICGRMFLGYTYIKRSHYFYNNVVFKQKFLPLPHQTTVGSDCLEPQKFKAPLKSHSYQLFSPVKRSRQEITRQISIEFLEWDLPDLMNC